MSSVWLKFLIIAWWLCNVCYYFQNVDLFQQQPRSANLAIFRKYLRFVETTMLQCFAGAVVAALVLKLTKRKPLAIPAFNKKIMAVVVLGHLTGTLALNAAISMHTFYVQNLFQSFESVMVYILWTCNRGYFVRNNIYVSCGIVLMSTGLHTFLRHQNLIFTRWGSIAAGLPLVMFPLRNVYLKSFGDNWKEPVEKYLVISSCAFLALLPVVLIKLAYTRIVPLMNPVMALKSISFHVIDNLISVFILETFSPIFHSVLHTFIQYSIGILTVIYLSLSISGLMAIGMILFLVGHVLYCQKYTSSNELRRFVMTCSLILHLIFGGNLLWNVKFNTDSSTEIRQRPPTVVHTLWVYNKPPNRDILLNMEEIYERASKDRLHVICGTFSCTRKVRDFNSHQFSTSFLTFDNFVRNSPVERWFKAHSLHKLLSGDNFEAHLHEATKLALLWHNGGMLVDPFLRIHESSFPELASNRNSWVTKIINGNLSGILHASRFKRHHPLVKTFANLFVKLYHRLCYLKANCEELVSNFNTQSWNAYVDFCSKNSRICPDSIEIVSQKMNTEIYTKHLRSTVQKLNTKSLSVGIENMAFSQFYPHVQRLSSNGILASAGNSTISHDMKADILPYLAESLRQKNGYLSEYIASLRKNAPIGCLNMNTVKYLRSQNIDAYLSGGIALLMKSPFTFGSVRKDVYIVNLNSSIINQLPIEIQADGLRLTLGEKTKFSLRSLFKSIYVFLKKIATAKLVITTDFNCASISAALNTPVLFVKTSNFTQDLSHMFHTWDPRNQTLNSTLISKFLSREIHAGVANLSFFMRVRATTWNAIRRDESALESALVFGVVPFARPRSNEVESVVFHLIFTTSEKSLISLEDKKKDGNVKGRFVWRHWRCLESIFYHHPLAKVIIHSNTLESRMFDVLREAGYGIQVKPYDIAALAKGTPAEVFVRDELPYAQEGEHWYSHETDLLRLLILYKFGGIYLDIDMIIVRRLHELPPNIIGWESGSNLNGAFLKFQKHHPYLYNCIERFSYSYSQAWSDNGPLLLSRVWRKWSAENPSNDVTTVARAAFYMFFYRGIQEQCFEESSGPVFNMNWRTLRTHAYAVHLYSKVTARYGDNGAKIKEGTLCKYILNAFCVLCIKVY